MSTQPAWHRQLPLEPNTAQKLASLRSADGRRAARGRQAELGIQRIGQQLNGVPRGQAGAVGDLVAAGHARRGHEIAFTSGAQRREEAVLADGLR